MRLRNNITIRILLFCSLTLALACAKEAKNETEVYRNDFENNNFAEITNPVVETYNGSKVLGRYNNGGFIVNIGGLPKHDLVEITFDLFIHDSWDGNRTDDNGNNGPDVWKMMIEGEEYINTTFSNSDCGTNYFCDPQSYPLNYPNNNNNPKTGAFNKNLPGVCLIAGQLGGTSQYRIIKRVRHDKNTLMLKCLDQLVQKNSNDKKCDESWSVDNLVIKTIQL
ncbi:MAG: hypothetical protein EOO89_30685 [Pedobacter sp.]|nr:MAG: hypothetical protein EOO89_30685 [Pedobacter sp.]